MRITSKGQVTIPQDVREAAGLQPGTDVDFVLRKGEVRLVKTKPSRSTGRKATRGQRAVARLSGSATVKMSTDELLALLRPRDKE